MISPNISILDGSLFFTISLVFALLSFLGYFSFLFSAISWFQAVFCRFDYGLYDTDIRFCGKMDLCV
jgi:hypothetical protein